MSSFSPLLLALVAGQSPVRKAALLAFEQFEDAIPLLSSATLAMAFFQWSGKISHQSQRPCRLSRQGLEFALH